MRFNAWDCARSSFRGPESFTAERWPKTTMRPDEALRDRDIEDATTKGYRPQGSRYGAAHAPMAVEFCPYKHGEVHACNRCEQVLVRTT